MLELYSYKIYVYLDLTKAYGQLYLPYVDSSLYMVIHCFTQNIYKNIKRLL